MITETIFNISSASKSFQFHWVEAYDSCMSAFKTQCHYSLMPLVLNHILTNIFSTRGTVLAIWDERKQNGD